MGRAVFSFPESHFLFNRRVWGSGGRRGWGRVALHEGQGLLWCKLIISFDVSWIRSVRLEKNLHFSFVFKQIVNVSVVGTVALVFLQNSFYTTSQLSLWFLPNIVHWLFSNTVYGIKWITKGSAPPVLNTRSPSPIILQLPASFNFNVANLIQIYNTTERTTARLSMLCKMRYSTGSSLTKMPKYNPLAIRTQLAP